MAMRTQTSAQLIQTLTDELHERELYHDGLVRLLCAVIDQFCDHQPVPSGPGRRLTYTHNLILKIDMLMHLTGKHGETEILRELKRHYQEYFPQLPGQARLWHRIRQALPLIERFRRWLRDRLGIAYESLRILDSFPIPVATLSSAPGQGNGFDLAEWGYCASKKLHYLGLKLGLVITPQGIPDQYDLFSARPHDSQLLDDLLGDLHHVIALGDKGFVGQAKQAQLANEQAVTLLTYRRNNQKQQNTPLTQALLDTYRRLIETVFSQLHDHMHLQDTGAKTDLGLVKRVMGILTAYTLGIYLNAILGRDLLAIKELFA